MAIAVGAPIDVADFSWNTYSPTWTTSGTAPSLGNGSIYGDYELTGKTVTAAGYLIIGSTSTMGTGSFYISLPVAVRTLGAESSGVGSAVFLDNGTTRYTATCRAQLVSGNWVLAFVVGGSSEASATNPMTWATGDTIVWSIVYRAA